jgi:hypothetical protein
MKQLLSLLACAVLLPLSVQSQSAKAESKTPSPEALTAAHKACTDLFANLAAGKTEEIASWITNEIGYMRDAASKLTLKNDFKSKLDLIVTSPPVSPYGKLSGFDLLDESYLPKSSRYFRLTYISYHEGAPLVWQFRFYVKPDGKIALNYITWSESDPFELVSKPEMSVGEHK